MCSARNTEVTLEDFKKIQGLLKGHCGILLSDKKQYLVSSRLSPLLRKHNIDSIKNLLRTACEYNSPILEEVINAMTTNETFWFRDKFPYNFLLNQALPKFLEEKSTGNLRIWSAACSTGQEPYSISIIVEQYMSQATKLIQKKARITATDISTYVLAQAKRGEYESLAIERGLESKITDQFFDEVESSRWMIKDKIKDRVSFRVLNLTQDFSSLGSFEIIFCRNVLIYFSSELKENIIKRLIERLVSGGYLVLGASESIANPADTIETIHLSHGYVYRKK